MALASGQDLVSLFRWWNNTGLALEVLLRNYLPSSGEHCYDNLRQIRYNTHLYFPKLTEGDLECEDGPQAASCQSLPYIYVYIYISSWRKWFWIQHFGVLAFQVKSQDETKVHVELIWPYLLNAYGQCLHTFLGTVRQNSQGVSFFFSIYFQGPRCQPATVQSRTRLYSRTGNLHHFDYDIKRGQKTFLKSVFCMLCAQCYSVESCKTASIITMTTLGTCTGRSASL